MSCIVLLIVKQTTRLKQKSKQNKPSYSVKQILEDNWEDYLKSNEVREVEKQEVDKTLSCKKISRGCFIFVREF